MSWGVSASNNHNYIINGDFRVWQRGTSFPASGVTADRWVRNLNTASSITTRELFTLGQVDVPGEPQYYLKAAVTLNNSSTPTFYQCIEGVRTLAGQTVTVSFYARADISRVLSVLLVQNFGTGGSPAPSTSVAVSGAVTLTTTFALYTVTMSLGGLSGKKIGTDGNDCLQLVFFGPGNTDCTLYFSQVKLEAGAVATPFVPLPFEMELALCQRYYEKSFDVETVPAQNAGRKGALEFPAVIAGGTVTIWTGLFKVQKRATPTMTWYSPGSNSAQVYNASKGEDCTGTTAIVNTATGGFGVAYTGPTLPTNQAPGDTLSLHWAADCELL